MNMIDIRKLIKKHPTKKPPVRKLSDIKKIVIHHSLTKDGNANAFANFHIGTNGWSCMGYTYVILKDGTIQWCADWTTVTPHVGNSNKSCLGINLVGDFRVEQPTEAQYKALYDLVEFLMKELKLTVTDVIGHQELPDYSWKQCPALHMGELRGNIQFKNHKPVKNNYVNDGSIEIVKPIIAPSTPKDSADGKLTRGEQGENVRRMIDLLRELEHTQIVGDVFNGYIEAALKAFQKAHGLKVDGIYTSEVGKKLVEAVENKSI